MLKQKIDRRRLAVTRLSVELVKDLLLHIDLAAYDQVRRRVFQPLRDVRDSAQVFGHVLANLPVPAGRAAHKNAVFIFQCDGQAVDLVFDRIFSLSGRTLDALKKFPQLLEGENVL